MHNNIFSLKKLINIQKNISPKQYGMYLQNSKKRKKRKKMYTK